MRGFPEHARAGAPGRSQPVDRRSSLRTRLTIATIVLITVFGTALVIALFTVLDLSATTRFERTPGDGRRDAVLRIELTRSVTLWSVMAVVTLAIIASAAIWFVLRRTLRRLEVATSAARVVGLDDLDARLPADGPRDEVRVLAETINAMLDRLATALGAQARFVANASHELRTPLATARSALDIPLAQGRVPADLEPDVRCAIAANERSARILDALLALARTTDDSPERLAPVDLAAVLDEAVHERDEAFRAAGVHLGLDLTPAVVLGDEAMIAQLCANLLDNAIVHNRPDGAIAVRCGVEHLDGLPHVVLEVVNDGTVLDPAGVDALREPFHRGEASRLQNPRAVHGSVGTGLGLGLGIVDEIATRHRGRLMLTARPDGGLAARVELPVGAQGTDPTGRTGP